MSVPVRPKSVPVTSSESVPETRSPYRGKGPGRDGVDTQSRCHICRHPLDDKHLSTTAPDGATLLFCWCPHGTPCAAPLCSQREECKERAMRRLGIPLHVVVKHQAIRLRNAAQILETSAARVEKFAEYIVQPKPHKLSEEMQQYYASDQWALLRRLCAERDKYHCCRCKGWAPAGQPHHVTYPKDIWDTNIDHLIWVHGECHLWIEAQKDGVV